jgi:hypothetical protein
VAAEDFLVVVLATTEPTTQEKQELEHQAPEARAVEQTTEHQLGVQANLEQ